MNDRELLELAAKAAGFGAQNPPDNPHCWTESEYPKRSGQHVALWNYFGYSDTAELWNPLTDDGDALRLAVKLKLRIATECNQEEAYASDTRGLVDAHNMNGLIDPVPWNGDPYAATRRAIVRAAAEIGRNMK